MVRLNKWVMKLAMNIRDKLGEGGLAGVENLIKVRIGFAITKKVVISHVTNFDKFKIM